MPMRALNTALSSTAALLALVSATTLVAQQPEADRYRQEADARGLGGVVGYGRGAAFADIDGDGDDDLFVADTDGRLFGPPFGMSQLYVNDGSGHFVPGEFNFNPADFHGTWAGSFADYDNDGDPDLLVLNGGYTLDSSVALLENRINQGAGFVNVSAQAGMGAESGAGAAAGWWGVSWADYDNDGWLDVVITRRQGRALLYHNNGDGTFDELGASLGLQAGQRRDAKNPVWLDYDSDGDQDLYLAGMDWHGFYRNDGDTFTDVTAALMPADMPGRSGLPAVFAAAAADFDQDGLDDLYLGRWDSQDLILFGDGDGGFLAVGADAGIDTANQLAQSETDRNPMGSQLNAARRAARANGPGGESAANVDPFENTMGLGIGDFYDDGFPDVVVGTGNPEFVARDVFFCNLGARRFERCTEQFVEEDDAHAMTRAHGAVFADVDHDGYTDFFFNLGGHPPFDFNRSAESRETNKLFKRQTVATANAAWLTLEGTVSNRDAIGATVRYGEGDQTRYRTLRSMQGFQSQNSPTLLLPLGEQESTPVIIDWPSGRQTTLVISSGEHVYQVEQ